MSSIMRWRSGEIGFVIGELLSLDCTNVQSLQTGDCLPMPSLRSSRPTGHDHYRNVRQSNPQIQHSQLGNWAADLRHRLPTAERFSATGGYGTSPGLAGSLRRDVGRADYLGPLGGIRLDDDSKLLRRIEGRLKTELRDPLAHVSLHGDLHDVRMHLADDGGRRAGWR